MRLVVSSVLAALCVVTSASRAQARDVSVRVEGCEGAMTATVAAALALELGAAWQVVPEADATVRVEVTIADCEAASWSTRLLDREGAVLRGPADLAMAGFPTASRARIAALWIAEWLATLDGEARAPTEGAALGAGAEPDADGDADPGGAADADPAGTDGADAGAGAAAAAGHGPEDRDGAAAAGAEAEPPDGHDEAPLLFRFVALATMRQIPETPATLGGVELGFQVARGGPIGIGAELGAGIEGGRQWSYDLFVVRGTLSAFLLLEAAQWIEIDIGARAALEHLPAYTRGAFREHLSGNLHGYMGGFLRTLLFVVPGIAITVDIEASGALTPVIYYVDQPPGAELPGNPAELLSGFALGVRAGIVLQ